MTAFDDFDALIDACITTHAKVVRHGSSEMEIASRILLYALAKEIRRRASNEITIPEDNDNRRS